MDCLVRIHDSIPRLLCMYRRNRSPTHISRSLLLIFLLLFLRNFPFALSLPIRGPAATPFCDLEIYYQSFDRRTRTFSVASRGVCNFDGSCENIFTRIDLFLPNGNDATIFLYNFSYFPLQIFSAYKKCVRIRIF